MRDRALVCVVLSGAVWILAERAPANPPDAAGFTRNRPPDAAIGIQEAIEREGRDGWQKPEQVISALGLAGDELVVEVGAGVGYFAFRLAEALPRGRVVATEITPEMVAYLRQKVASRGVTNVQVRLVLPEEPGLPANADVVFVCDVLGHMGDWREWIRQAHAGMGKGSRLIVIGLRMSADLKTTQGDVVSEALRVPKADIVEHLTQTGFELSRDHGDILPHQYFLEFRRP